MLGFTKSVALELGSRNIRCNAIAPGFIETEMTAKLDETIVDGWRQAIPLKRGGSPEDIANACVFLSFRHECLYHGDKRLTLTEV